jgi:subtilase family serine protease
MLRASGSAHASADARAHASASARADAPPAIVQVWLKPDIAGATAFADAASTPGRAGFQHHLSPNAYTTRFGASAAHAKAVADWLTGAGMKQVRVSSGRDYVLATGTVTSLTPPASVAPDVLGVTGLRESMATRAATTARASAAKAKSPTCSQYWAQHVQSFQPAYQGFTKGSLPICGYSADQIRTAYGATSAATGKGVTVALTEDSPPAAMFTTLTDYAKNNHLPAPRSDQFRQIQDDDVCGDLSSQAARAAHPHRADAAFKDEAQMDSEAVYAVAPDADQLMVVGGGCDQSLLDAVLTVLVGDGARPSATLVSNSWQFPLGAEPAQVLRAINLRAAAEGVGMYFASGDVPGLTMTASDPYVTAVGGTTLGIGAHGERVFETGWSTDSATLDSGKWTDAGIGGAGGGTSLDEAEPAYQKGVAPASLAHRSVPDLAADADPDTGLLIGYIESGTDAAPGPYQTAPNAGTSMACPLIVGLVADAQQGRTTPFGFINPLLYRLAGTDALHDILPPSATAPVRNRVGYQPAADGSAPAVDVFASQDPKWTQQVVVKGYDTMTGVGTPNGAAFLTGLREASR